MKKPIVIAGNGPSLAQIDYRRLPADFDVFRCNQFYFEDKYFLGRRITGVFLHAWLVKNQYFTLRTLEERGEYTFEQMYYFLTVPDFQRFYGPDLEGDYPRLKSTYSHWAAVPQFLELCRFLDVYYQKRFTSGISMLISALGLGYREIYLCGIDFYAGGG